MTSEQGDQLEVARKIALDLLAVRQRSAHELGAAMARRNVPDDVAGEIIARFTGVGLVDDEAFAAALTSTRSTVGQRGRHRIRAELQAKGIDREVAESALADLDPDDELEAALALARRRARSMTSLEPHVARRRLAGVLARRGFPSSVVSAAVSEALGGSVEFSTGQE
ncbi:regulatory protein RecX [Tessaracoccus flavus]|uniref:Regulatory protein RecX n=1 Tax=Tessaracoccus flavus TaxID=1610493 RepID=A0A1Q2CES5_9ACTN|nr:regulatory protein RecX [Tessaracoccus flavus]AQP44606.1 hypothetical protein RPIT_07080 [Tessaracoccus flavus]